MSEHKALSKNIRQEILGYFQLHFKDKIIHLELKLSELGFESIDYIHLASYLLKNTNQWLDISKINKEMTISDIEHSLLTLDPPQKNPKNRVKLDEIQKLSYNAQFNKEKVNRVTYVVHYLELQDHVDLARLVDAVIATIKNHFILQCKIMNDQEALYLTLAEPQDEILLKSSFLNSDFFSKKDIKKLAITVFSNRLVNIYLQKKKNKYYLIINFHHIILDGWGHKVMQEEIFRRYAGLPVKNTLFIHEVNALNTIYYSSMNEHSIPEELLKIYKAIDPKPYHNLNCLFGEQPKMNYSCLLISKKEIDFYAHKKNISDYSYSTIFTFMFYEMISQAANKSKILLYVTLSNRFLPITDIIELVGNASIALPLFLDRAQLSTQQFGQHIDDLLAIYFKHMSYGAVIRALLAENTLFKKYIAPFELPYHLLLTYTNNITKKIYNEDPITGNYIHWNNSKSYIDYPNKKLFCDIYDLGTECFLEFHSKMKVGVHEFLFKEFMVKNFPESVKKMNK